MALLLECFKKNVHIYLITMREKKKLPREKNEFYVHITMIAEIRLAALLARATLLAFNEEVVVSSNL